MLIPLAIINHFKPTRELPGLKQLHELYPLGTEHKDFTLPRDPRFFAWRNFFLRADHALKLISKLEWRPMRRRALEEAERWMVERIGEGSDGLAAVFPAMLNSLIALARARLFPAATRSTKRRRRISPDSSSTIRRIFAFSPACRRSGTRRSTSSRWRNPACPRSIRRWQNAANWLLDKEVRLRGRLGGEQSASRTERLGLRIQQRLLSGHGRHRDGADGAASGAAEGAERAAAKSSSAPSPGS